MKKRSNDYWINRSNELLANIHNQSTPYVLEVNKYYEKAIKDLQKDINKIFQTYANNHNLTYAEAKKLLNSKISTEEIEHLRKKLSQISNDELRKALLAQLNANAYRARISRLEALKQAVQVHYMEVADKQMTLTESAYINTIEESYYRTAYNLQKGIDIGFNIAQIPEHSVQAILNTNWSGKLYSERIWNNSQATIDAISETLTSGFISGKSIPNMVKEIEELTEYGKYAAERLIRTETTFFANQGSIASYNECEVEKYIFIATLDLRTSETCRKHDRKIYEVAKAMPGENLPPMHVFCRSTTRAYLGEEYMQDIQRRARDPVTGKTYLVDDMNYEEWYSKYVKGNPQAELAEKKLKNMASDKKQHERYRGVLGKDVPKSFDEFQEVKYGNQKMWEELTLKKSLASQLSKLTDEERDVLTRYTGYLAENINKGLGAYDERKIARHINDIQLLDSALAKGVITKDITVIRKTIPQNMNLSKGFELTEKTMKKLEGQVLYNDIFTSTALKNFKYQGRNVYINLKVPKGYQGALYIKSLARGKYKEQEEILFQRGLKYKINHVSMKDDIYYMDAEVIK